MTRKPASRKRKRKRKRKENVWQRWMVLTAWGDPYLEMVEAPDDNSGHSFVATAVLTTRKRAALLMANGRDVVRVEIRRARKGK